MASVFECIVSGFAFVAVGLAAQSAPRQPKNNCQSAKHGGMPAQLAAKPIYSCIAAIPGRCEGFESYAARMLDKNASISERSTLVSCCSALEALSTSPAADPASA